MPKGQYRRGRKPRAATARLDVRKIVAAYGGVEKLIARHAAAGFAELSYNQVGNWRLRCVIPAQRLIEIMSLTPDRGIDFAACVKVVKHNEAGRPDPNAYREDRI